MKMSMSIIKIRKGVGLLIVGYLFSTGSLSAFNFKKIKIDIPKPTAKIEKFKVKEISLRDITFLFNVSIKNPYPISIKLSGIDLDFFIEKTKLFSTSTSKGFKIKAKGKASNPFTMNLVYENIIKIVKDYKDKEYLNLNINVAIHIPLPKYKGLPRNITLRFKLHKKIPAIKPKIRIKNFKVLPPTIADLKETIAAEGRRRLNAKFLRRNYKSLFSGKKTSKKFKPAELDILFNVSFDIEIKNEAKGKLIFDDVAYNFFVNSDPLVAGRTTDVKRKGNTITLTILNQFSSKNLSKAIIKAFKRQKGKYSMRGSTSVLFPSFVSQEPILLEFDEKGNFNLK